MGNFILSSTCPMMKIITAVVIPRIDQRRLISSKRPAGPATEFMTTEKVIDSRVCGKVARAQISRIAVTRLFLGTIKAIRPVRA